MSYSVELTKAASSDLARLPSSTQTKIVRALTRLAAEPFAMAGVKKLSGVDAYRLRAGDYRVLYRIERDRLIVLVIKIGHRREVYR